jgi:hypothetical protein
MSEGDTLKTARKKSSTHSLHYTYIPLYLKEVNLQHPLSYGLSGQRFHLDIILKRIILTKESVEKSIGHCRLKHHILVHLQDEL